MSRPSHFSHTCAYPRDPRTPSRRDTRDTDVFSRQARTREHRDSRVIQRKIAQERTASRQRMRSPSESPLRFRRQASGVSRPERAHPRAGFLDERSRTHDTHPFTRTEVSDVVRDEQARSCTHRGGEDRHVLDVGKLGRPIPVA